MKEKSNAVSRLDSLENTPYIIAEIGVNHEGSMELARRMISEAKIGGADAVKFQTYKAADLAIKNSPSYWDLKKEKTRSQFELFKKYDSFNESNYIDLKNFCDKEGIEFLSTPFDVKSLTFLKELMPFFKIASADITNIELIREVAKIGKPIILSTGAATLDEIRTSINEIYKFDNSEVGLLHCVLNYPTKYEDAGLKAIQTLKREFPNNVIGYSDHTIPESDMLTLTTAVINGAKIIEKHFTFDKSLPGNDHYHAMDVNDLKVFRMQLSKLNMINKNIDFGNRENESEAIKNARRSIVSTKEINSGEFITEDMVSCKRPGTGISSSYWDKVIGKRVIKKIKADQQISWSDLN